MQKPKFIHPATPAHFTQYNGMWRFLGFRSGAVDVCSFWIWCCLLGDWRPEFQSSLLPSSSVVEMSSVIGHFDPWNWDTMVEMQCLKLLCWFCVGDPNQTLPFCQISFLNIFSLASAQRDCLTLILPRSRTGTVWFYTVPVRERYGSTLLPATREQHDQNCTQSH